VNGTHGEDSALVLGQAARDLLPASLDETILDDDSELELGALSQSQELGGAGVVVGGVDATGIEETNGGRDAEICEDGEGADVGSGGLAARCNDAGIADACFGGGAEVEDNFATEGIAGQEGAILGEELLEAGEGCRGVLELSDERAVVDSRGRGWRGGIHVARVAAGKSLHRCGSESSDDDLEKCGRHYRCWS